MPGGAVRDHPPPRPEGWRGKNPGRGVRVALPAQGLASARAAIATSLSCATAVTCRTRAGGECGRGERVPRVFRARVVA